MSLLRYGPVATAMMIVVMACSSTSPETTGPGGPAQSVSRSSIDSLSARLGLAAPRTTRSERHARINVYNRDGTLRTAYRLTKAQTRQLWKDFTAGFQSRQSSNLQHDDLRGVRSHRMASFVDTTMSFSALGVEYEFAGASTSAELLTAISTPSLVPLATWWFAYNAEGDSVVVTAAVAHNYDQGDLVVETYFPTEALEALSDSLSEPEMSPIGFNNQCSSDPFVLTSGLMRGCFSATLGFIAGCVGAGGATALFLKVSNLGTMALMGGAWAGCAATFVEWLCECFDKCAAEIRRPQGSPV